MHSHRSSARSKEYPPAPGVQHLQPESKVFSALEADGHAWLFNQLSHMEERPPRTGIYVMDPHTIEVVDTFNLNHPFPTWAESEDAKTIHTCHTATVSRIWKAGHRAGITRLDLESGLELFTPTPSVRNASSLGVYRDRPCLTRRAGPEGEGQKACI